MRSRTSAACATLITVALALPALAAPRIAPAANPAPEAKPSPVAKAGGGIVEPRAVATTGALAKGTADATVTVMVDHAKIIRLPERTQTVIVGNPIIADVSTQKNGVLVLTGKSYGVTNLIALDASGTMLAESLISVQAPSEAVVMVQRGLERESYSCTPACQPSMILGDSTKYFSEVGGQADQRSTMATKK